MTKAARHDTSKIHDSMRKQNAHHLVGDKNKHYSVDTFRTVSGYDVFPASSRFHLSVDAFDDVDDDCRRLPATTTGSDTFCAVLFMFCVASESHDLVVSITRKWNTTKCRDERQRRQIRSVAVRRRCRRLLGHDGQRSYSI